MPASRTAESLPTPSYESFDAAKNDAEMHQGMEYARMQLSTGVREQKKDIHEYTEDAFYISDTVVGVFDGVGGSRNKGGNPAAAARVAAESMGELLSTSSNEVASRDEIIEQLEAALEYGRREATTKGEGGKTVGTVAKVYNYNGRSVVGVAHAGDTRLFHYSGAKNAYTDVTPDQSHGRFITNGLFYDERNEPDYCGVIDIQPGDKLMLCSDGITGDNSDEFLSKAQFIDAFSQPTADASAQRFLELSKKVDDKTVVMIEVDEIATATIQPEKTFTPKDHAAMIKMRQTKKTISDRKTARTTTLSERMQAVTASQAASGKHAAQPTVAGPTPAASVTPLVMAQSKRTPKHAATPSPEAAARSGEITVDEERQQSIDEQRGFTIVDKRVWHELEDGVSRDELIASIAAGELPKRTAPKHAAVDSGPSVGVATSGEPTPATEGASTTSSPATENLGVHGPMNQEPMTQIPPKPAIPPKPNHDPTVHLNTVDIQSAGDTTTSAENDKQATKDKLTDKIAMSFHYLAAQMDAARMIRQNKREARDAERGIDTRDKNNKAFKRVMGTTAAVLVGVTIWKFQPELQGVADDLFNNLPPKEEGKVDATRDRRIVEQAQERAQEIAARREALLNLPIHDIPVSGGGEAYAVASGVDPNLWYQNQDEFLQLFPNEGYRMDDGNVGFSRPGELSDAAKEYWARKFGKWL